MFELNKNEQLLSAMSDNILKQGIYVGVAIILESSDSRIMLTQRADHMRSFPKTWVPPGGHLGKAVCRMFVLILLVRREIELYIIIIFYFYNKSIYTYGIN